VGVHGLLLALLAACLTRPARLLGAVLLAVRHGLRSDAGVLKHLAYVAEACVLRGWLAQSGATHVHAHFGTNSTTVAMLCHLLGGPGYSFTAHGPEEFDKPLMLGLADKITHARFVVAVSDFGRSQLFRHASHAHWSKIHVVHCGLDRDLLGAEAAPLPDALRLCCVARLHEQKGQLLLLDALARVVARGVDLQLVLVGDGELRADIEALIARHQLASRVTITGWVDAARVRREIEAARLFVLPSFAEGLPVVLMEALALGRPALTTYIAGIPELITPDCGFLVPAGSVDALAAELARAASLSNAELSRMGQAGRERVRARHDVDVEAAKLGVLFAQSPA
jgi:glycosyltransferase involved in cell wall biosynthesis